MSTYYAGYYHEYNYFHQAYSVNNKVYIFAGQDAANGAEAIVEYMPSASPWAKKDAPPCCSAYMASVAIGSKIYLAGGYGVINAGFKYMPELYEYDAQQDTWALKPNMGTPRSNVAGVAAGGKFYAIGGEIAANGAATNVVEEYDPGSNKWEPKHPLQYTAHSVAVAFPLVLRSYRVIGAVCAFQDKLVYNIARGRDALVSQADICFSITIRSVVIRGASPGLYFQSKHGSLAFAIRGQDEIRNR